MRNEYLKVKEKAVAEGYLIRIIDKKTEAITYYTYDYNKNYFRNSTGIIYDKYAKQIKDNKISHKLLRANPYKTRFEIKLYNNETSEWVALDNISGNYKEIMKKHLEYLAIIYKKYFIDFIDINTSENKYLSKIESVAKTTDYERYMNHNGSLKKKTPLSAKYCYAISLEDKEREISKLSDAFFEQVTNIENDKNYLPIIKILAKYEG
jgi:hypothetical protein